MIVRWGSIRCCEARKFLCKLIRLVDEDRQTLRANVQFLLLKFQTNERSIHFGCAAVETGQCWHWVSLKNYVATDRPVGIYVAFAAAFTSYAE